jgi:hypothetical protein
VKRLWEKFMEPWESVRIEIDEIIDAGELSSRARPGGS